MVRFGGFRRVAKHLRLRWRGCTPVAPAKVALAKAGAASMLAADSGRRVGSTASNAVPAPSAAGPSLGHQAAAGAVRRAVRRAAGSASSGTGHVAASRATAAATARALAVAWPSPALAEAAVEVRALMAQRSLRHVPSRADFEAAGALRRRHLLPVLL